MLEINKMDCFLQSNVCQMTITYITRTRRCWTLNTGNNVLLPIPAFLTCEKGTSCANLSTTQTWERCWMGEGDWVQAGQQSACHGTRWSWWPPQHWPLQLTPTEEEVQFDIGKLSVVNIAFTLSEAAQNPAVFLSWNRLVNSNISLLLSVKVLVW
jgi:hypothetical protein